VATSPIRIRDEDKGQLERLRREITAATGTRLPQQDVVGKALEFALRHRERFLVEAAWKPLTAAEIRRWSAKTHALGAWSIDEIDDIVYGNEAP